MRRFLRLIIVFFSAAIVLLGLSVTVFAVPLQRPLSSTTWTVGGTCGTTIQACINVASNGDTVLIPAGTYNEHLALNGRTITLTRRPLSECPVEPMRSRSPLTGAARRFLI